MLWRQSQFCRKVFSPFLNGLWPCTLSQTACGVASRAMKASQHLPQETFHPKGSIFSYPHAPSLQRLRSLSAPRSHRLGFASLQQTSCSLPRSSEDCGPLDSRTDLDIVTQHCLPSPTPAGELLEVFYPTLLHSCTFLQIFPPESGDEESMSNYTILILNHKLPLLTSFLWSKACCRICADGGANQIYDCIPKLFPHEDSMKVRKRYKPDVIKGDLDSIRPEVKDFYSRLGTKIIDKSEDQDTTDLWKCVAYAADSIHEIKRGQMELLVLGALGGRLDHEFANLNVLHSFRDVRIILLSDESMAFLLPRGYKHEIRIDSSLEGPYCGLLPLAGPSLCTTTTGLKWDLHKASLQFGGVISTSNMPVGDHVKVSSDADLVWTISLQRLHSRLEEQMGLASDFPF